VKADSLVKFNKNMIVELHFLLIWKNKVSRIK